VIEKYAMEKQAKFLNSYPKLGSLIWGEDEEYLYLGFDNYSLAVIPKGFVLIDTEKLKEKYPPFKAERIRKILMNESEHIPAQKVGTKISEGKELVILESQKQTVYVDSKLLKNFPKDVTFETTGEKTAVRIYLNGAFIGIAIPVFVPPRK
jgi:hypothetical protein